MTKGAEEWEKESIEQSFGDDFGAYRRLFPDLIFGDSTMSDNDYIINVENLNKSYGAHKVINDLSIKIPRGKSRRYLAFQEPINPIKASFGVSSSR